jgi:transposase
MKQFSKYVGLDVHKETIAVADGVTNEVRFVGEIVNAPEAINKLIKQLKVGDAVLKFCYEAGPCGYGIHRQLTDPGWDCIVVATSLIRELPLFDGHRIVLDQGGQNDQEANYLSTGVSPANGRTSFGWAQPQ